MTLKHWPNLGPSLVVGVGIIGATLIAVRTAESRWLVLAGPFILALVVVGADAWASRLRGKSPRASPAAWLLGGTFLLAGLIVTLRDPGLVKTLVPLMGSASWVTLLLPVENRRKACRDI